MFNNTIFALDDELIILDLFKEILTNTKVQKRGFFESLQEEKEDAAAYDLHTFATPRLYLDSLESWYAQGYRVPLSIIDMRLPHMHGLECKFHSKFPPISQHVSTFVTANQAVKL